jgi:DNA replication protein DnaC
LAEVTEKGGATMQHISSFISKALDIIAPTDRVKAEPGDYMGEDGLLRCGKCGGKKETRLPIDGRYSRCSCLCELARIAEEEAQRERRKAMEKVQEMAACSLVDAKFKESTFSRFIAETEEDERVLRICRNYVTRFSEMTENNTGLIFFGGPGTGKTFAASCIANALMRLGVPVLVTSIVRLTASAFDGDLNALLNRMNAAELLVLDDFGAERNTEFKAEQLFAVIDARYAAKKPMIITTNLTDFKTETDVRRKRVYDRVFEACIPVKMDGKSKRRAAGQEKRNAMMAVLEA